MQGAGPCGRATGRSAAKATPSTILRFCDRLHDQDRSGDLLKLAVEEAACERIDEIRPSELLAIYVLGRRDRSVMLNQVSVVVESTSFPERLPLSFAVALQLSVYGKQLSKTQGRYFFCCSDRFVGLIA